LFFVQETAIQTWLVIGNFTMGNMHRLHTTVVRVRVMVFNAPFSNISDISWRPVLLAEETGVTNYLLGLWCLMPLSTIFQLYPDR
jgi:hypothetical protein